MPSSMPRAIAEASLDAETSTNAVRALPAQPVDRSPVRKGSTPGVVADTVAAAMSSRLAPSRRRVPSSQLTARPTSLRAPPSRHRDESIR